MMYSSILLIIRKRLKISMVKIFKGFILIIIENIEYKDFRIELIKKELLLNMYRHTY